MAKCVGEGENEVESNKKCEKIRIFFSSQLRFMAPFSFGLPPNGQLTGMALTSSSRIFIHRAETFPHWHSRSTGAQSRPIFNSIASQV